MRHGARDYLPVHGHGVCVRAFLCGIRMVRHSKKCDRGVALLVDFWLKLWGYERRRLDAIKESLRQRSAAPR